VKAVPKMTLAFALINVQSGAEEAVLKEIQKLPNVTEVNMVYGTYDLIVKIEADTLELASLKRYTVGKVHCFEGCC